MPGEVTQWLLAMDSNDPRTAGELLELVYDELRRLAAARLAGEQPGNTLQPTALVHEAWIRLAGANQNWSGRSHFFGAAAEAMRRILVEQARRKSALKRGARAEMEPFDESQFEVATPPDELVAIHEALDQLSAEDPVASEVVKLRYFVGMTNAEVAETLGMAPRSVDRHWSYGRAWLKAALRQSGFQ